MSRRLARSHSVVTRLRALSCPTSTRKVFSRTSDLLRPTSDLVSNERLPRNGRRFDDKPKISAIPNMWKVRGFTKLWKSDRSWKHQKLRCSSAGRFWKTSVRPAARDPSAFRSITFKSRSAVRSIVSIYEATRLREQRFFRIICILFFKDRSTSRNSYLGEAISFHRCNTASDAKRFASEELQLKATL